MGRLTGPTVLVATRSVHKLDEIRRLLADTPVRLVGPAELDLEPREEEEDLEPFDTFAANALSKARYFHGRSGVPTLADDSGLCVDALDGAPGVRTKRFAPAAWAVEWGVDRANNRWLLSRLEGVPPERRGAHYASVLAGVDERGEAVFEGRVEGVIAEAPRGEGGFGYDPLFVPWGETRTYAELPPEVKERTSHRAGAARAARAWIAGARPPVAPPDERTP